MLGKIVPEKAGSGIVHQGKVLIETVARVLRTLTTAINNRPDFFDVVGRCGSIGPKMTVGGNVSTVIKVVEHSELQREFVLVRRNLGAVHGQ